MTAHTIKYCFRKAGFQWERNTDGLTLTQQNEYKFDNGKDWARINAAIGDDFHFEDYVSVDDAVVTSELYKPDDVIVDTANDDAGNNSDSEDDVSSETTEEKVSSRCEALDAISVLRNYIGATKLNNSRVLQYVNFVENFIINIRPEA